MPGKKSLPVTKADVMATLRDPRVKNINFSVNHLVVSADGYQEVSEYIERGLIRVRAGTDRTLAFYDRAANEIITSPSSRPLDDATMANIVHECTHAWADITGIKIRGLAEEVAAYLAEHAFYWMGRPVLATALGPDVGPSHPIPPRAGAAEKQQLTRLAHAHLIFVINQIVVRYNLNTPAGFGVEIRERDIWDLAIVINMTPEYRTIGWNDLSGHAGVPIRGNSLWALGQAIRRGRAPRR